MRDAKRWLTPGATAGFLDFTGQGLQTFERAMDCDEKLLPVLGSRLLKSRKKVAETAQAIELRQSGENSILANIATSVSASLTQVLRWTYWWNSTEESPDAVTRDQVLVELNTDFNTKGLSAPDGIPPRRTHCWLTGSFGRQPAGKDG